MCGIVGVVGALAADPEVVAKMTSRVRHRGPDSVSGIRAGELAVSLCRLAVRHEDDGWQPVRSRDGQWLGCVNGEVFNCAELESMLGADAAPGPNRSDVVYVADVVAKWGVNGLRRIDGQFAFILHHKLSGTVLLGRDRFGICPLFYRATPLGTFFSSEMGPLIEVARGRLHVDIVGLEQGLFLRGPVAPRTLIREISQVEPGCVAKLVHGEVTLHRWWRYGEFDTGTSGGSADDLAGALQAAVRFRLESDTTVGCLVSGGLDSSLIAALSARITQTPVPIFSCRFPGSHLDEGQYQAALGQAFGRHEVWCSVDDVTALLPDVVIKGEVPIRETYNAAAFLLSAKVREVGVKAVLTGQGADELFYGYASFLFDQAHLARRPGADERNRRLWGRDDFNWELNWVAIDRLRSRLLSPALFARARDVGEFWNFRVVPFADDEIKGLTTAQLRSVVDVHAHMSVHLLADHGDRMSMANSVEARFPYLSNAVVDVALAMPDESKLGEWETKQCLKEIAKGYLPSAVVNRVKQGFVAPTPPMTLLMDAFGGEWKAVAGELFAADGLASILAEADSGRHGARAWALTVLSVAHLFASWGVDL